MGTANSELRQRARIWSRAVLILQQLQHYMFQQSGAGELPGQYLELGGDVRQCERVLFEYSGHHQHDHAEWSWGCDVQCE